MTSIVAKHGRVVLGIFLVAAALVGLACGTSAAPPPSPTTAPAPTASVTLEITVTDIAGRTVGVKKPVERMLLAESRMIYAIAMLETEDPFRRIVGWRDDVERFDHDTYLKYKEKFPQIADIPRLGDPGTAGFSAEKAIELNPDVFILTFDFFDRAKESGLIDQLAKVGIPTVVIDYRRDPLENTIPSTFLLGRLLGKEERAQEVVDFYLGQVNQVYSRVEKIKKAKPKVFLYRAAGIDDSCCGTFGRANLGLLVEKAGGTNIAADLVGWSGTLNPEQVLVSNPDVIIATGANWVTATGKPVRLGYFADPQSTQASLKGLSDRPGWDTLPAVKDSRFHVVWHQFYISIYHFAVLQQFAKWLYPEEFQDLNPAANLKEFHDRFLPIGYSGMFWDSLQQ
jgi:iron complex transport system substrate-binding protein